MYYPHFYLSINFSNIFHITNQIHDELMPIRILTTERVQETVA